MAKEHNSGKLAKRTVGDFVRLPLRRRWLAAVVVIAGLAAVITACGDDEEVEPTPTTAAPAATTAAPPATTAGLSGTVTMMRGPFSADDTVWEDPLVAAFNAQHPGVEIVRTAYDWAAADAEIAAAFASGSPPDIIYLPDQWYGQYAVAGQLEPITDLVNDPAFADDFAAIPQAFWDVATIDGEIYGVPALGVVFPIFVNVDLLEEAGVADTWDDSYEALADAARKLTTDDVWGFSFRSEFIDAGYWDWFPYIQNAGGNVLNDDWTACGFNSPEVVEGVQFLIDTIEEGIALPPGEYDWAGQKALFSAGKIAINHNEGSFINELLTNDPGFRWEVLPAPPGPVTQTMMGNFGFLFISSASENKEAAWEYIKHWASAEQAAAYTEANSLFSIRSDLVNPYADNPVMARVLNEYVPMVQGIQAHPRMREILNTIWPTFSAAYRGQYTAQEAVDKACADMASLLG